MPKSKHYTISALAAATSLLLAACGAPAGTPVVQTVVVTQEVVKEVEVEKIVEITATPVPEWTRPHPILSDARVRKAIAHCTNRKALIDSVYPFLPEEEREKLFMDTFIPKDSVWYAKNVDPNANIVDYPYDPEKGKALLEEAGWKLPEGGSVRVNDKGEPLALRFTTTNAPFRQTWGAVFVKSLQDCGIQLLPSYIPGSIWFGGNSGLRRRDFELGAFAWVGETEPPGVSLYACDQIPRPDNNWNGQNYMGWCNERASTAIKQANNTLNDAERKRLYVIVQEEFSKDMVSLPLFQRLEATAHNKDLKGLKADPTEYYTASIADWELPGKDTVIIALGQEPQSLFLLQESAAVAIIVGQAVFGTTYTQYSYGFQPVLLEGDQFPTIENGGAQNVEVEVKDGDLVVNADGDVGTFKDGKLVDREGKELSLKGKDINGNEVDIKAGTKLPQLTVTYKFKPHKWSDGEPVKKADWELGYKVACDRESGNVSYFTCDRVVSFEALDDNSYRVVYAKGYQPPTYYLPPFGYYPSHQKLADGRTLAEVEPKEFKNLKEVTDTPLGTGPYVIKEWQRGQRIVMEANPNFWKGEPKIKNVIFQVFEGGPAGAVAALLQGTVDVVGKEVLGAGQELQTVIEESKKGTIVAVPMGSPTWEHVDFNLNVR
ncbi:MAG: ABC transporter substrate-binding protein [Anaerolineae bacterium]|nr:ABC transporter substrate-binding protein [Thermoflexales bacterium]MCX7940066.1 ABC transporter substrate-binding protein [Thermoflexales bacterium]MDW8293088.1 ABC transporter substrate-binding protein [Anaerolineae bacterium]